MKKIYSICRKCNKDKKASSTSVCSSCAREYRLSKKKDMTEVNKKIYEFVSRVEKRNGMASGDEIFVELITLFYETNPVNTYDKLSVKKQVERMYIHLKNHIEWEGFRYNIYKKKV